LILLVSGEMSSSEKLSILLWITGFETFAADINNIPNEFILDIIICLHLFKHKVMRLSEAEAMMQVIVDARNDDVPMSRYPTRVNVHAFRLTFLHSKVFFNLLSCISAVGLKDFENVYKFDGAHFQRIYATICHTGSESAFDTKSAFDKLAKIVLKMPTMSQPQAEFDEREDDSPEMSAFKENSKMERLKYAQNFCDENYKEGNFQDCLRYVNDILKLTESLKHRNIKAECLIMLGKMEEAEVIIDAALKQNPQDFNMIYIDGLKDYHEVNLKESVEMFDKAIRINSKFTKAIQQRAKAVRLLQFIHKGKK
jgi:tetratricopeptide (TPR) repeat protein